MQYEIFTVVMSLGISCLISPSNAANKTACREDCTDKEYLVKLNLVPRPKGLCCDGNSRMCLVLNEGSGSQPADEVHWHCVCTEESHCDLEDVDFDGDFGEGWDIAYEDTDQGTNDASANCQLSILTTGSMLLIATFCLFMH